MLFCQYARSDLITLNRSSSLLLSIGHLNATQRLFYQTWFALKPKNQCIQETNLFQKLLFNAETNELIQRQVRGPHHYRKENTSTLFSLLFSNEFTWKRYPYVWPHSSNIKPYRPHLVRFSSSTGNNNDNNPDDSTANEVVSRSLTNRSQAAYNKLYNGIVHNIHWVKNGFKLLGANAQVSLLLIKKKIKGHQLNYREHKLLIQTLGDIFKLIPFSLFIIVPFAEILLPPFLWLFPRMLPSTFARESRGTSYLNKKLAATQQLTEFFQELVMERTKQILEKSALKSQSQLGRAELLKQFHEKLLKKAQVEQTSINQKVDIDNVQLVSPFLSLEEILHFAELFKEEFTLDNLPIKTLIVMCQMLGLEPYRFRTSVLLQLRHHIAKIQKEDRDLYWEGVENLSHDELVEACRSRAMRYHLLSDDAMREQLLEWLKLSSHKDITPVLLLWSRSITVTHTKEIQEKKENTQGVTEGSENSAETVTSTEELLPQVSIVTPEKPAQDEDEQKKKLHNLQAIAEALKISEKTSFDQGLQSILDYLMSNATKPLDYNISGQASKLSFIENYEKLKTNEQALKDLTKQHNELTIDIIQNVKKFINNSQSLLKTNMENPEIRKQIQEQIKQLSQYVEEQNSKQKLLNKQLTVFSSTT